MKKALIHLWFRMPALKQELNIMYSHRSGSNDPNKILNFTHFKECSKLKMSFLCTCYKNVSHLIFGCSTPEKKNKKSM